MKLFGWVTSHSFIKEFVAKVLFWSVCKLEPNRAIILTANVLGTWIFDSGLIYDQCGLAGYNSATQHACSDLRPVLITNYADKINIYTYVPQTPLTLNALPSSSAAQWQVCDILGFVSVSWRFIVFLKMLPAKADNIVVCWSDKLVNIFCDRQVGVWTNQF